MSFPEVEKIGSLNSRQPNLTGSHKHCAHMAQTSEARAAGGHRSGPHTQQIPEDVIILADDDDDDDDGGSGSGSGSGEGDDSNDSGGDPSDHESSNAESDEEAGESDATSRKVPDVTEHVSRGQGMRYNSDNPSAVPSHPADDSDDDCQVISEMPPRQDRAGSGAPRGFRSPITVDEDTARADAPNRSAPDSDSDCEILDASQGDIRRQWEEAALRRRMSSVLKSEASNVGRGATSDLRKDSPMSSRGRSAPSPQPPTGEREKHCSKHQQTRAESVATSTDTDVGKAVEEHISAERLNVGEIRLSRDEAGPSNVGEATVDRTRTGKAAASAGAASISQIDGLVVEEQTSKSVTPSADAEPAAPPDAASSGQCEQPGHIKVEAFDHASQLPDSHTCHEPLEQVGVESPDDALVDKDKLKETDAFRQADNEEWARRNIELQRQASEAQRLRKRKRAEADRKLEMESRQKQRVEEIRQFQHQEEVTLGLKDELRGQIRGRLEGLAKGCPDMATLLRRLSVPVEGGNAPTVKQVGDSYKRAVLKFHPDRASRPANGDPRNQVEAEETFKLISRLKNSLPLVSRPALQTRYFSF